VPTVSLHSSVTTDSVSRLCNNTCVQAEHAVDHGHEISTFHWFQHGLQCIMLCYTQTVLKAIFLVYYTVLTVSVCADKSQTQGGQCSGATPLRNV